MISIFTEAENFVKSHPQLNGNKDYWIIEIGNAMLETSLKVVVDLEEGFNRDVCLSIVNT